MIAWWLFHFWKKTQMNQILLCLQPDKHPESHKLLLTLPWVSVTMRNRKRIAYKINLWQGEFSSGLSWFSYSLKASGIIYIAVTHTEVTGMWSFQSNLGKIRLRCSSIGPRWYPLQTPHLVLAVALESPRQVGAELADSLGLALELRS